MADKVAEIQQGEIAGLLQNVRAEAQKEKDVILQQMARLRQENAEMATKLLEKADLELAGTLLRQLMVQMSADYSKKLAQAETLAERSAVDFRAQLAQLDQEKALLAQQLAAEQEAKKQVLLKKVWVLSWTKNQANETTKFEFYSTQDKAVAAKNAMTTSARRIGAIIVANIYSTLVDDMSNAN